VKRLREQAHDGDPALARAAALLAKVEPTADSAARQRRIRRTVDRPAKRYALRLLRPFAVFGLAMGIAASAAAMYGVAHVVRELIETETPDPVNAHDPSPALAQGETGSSRAPEPLAPPELPTAASTSIPSARDPVVPAVSVGQVPAPAAAPLASRPDARTSDPLQRTAKPAPARLAEPSSSERSSGSEARIVQRGLEALRKHNDPKQAARYLERYRREHPNGTLAEEALALSVEAASASGDPRAKQLAVDYLSRYPQGRFRSAARQALAKALAQSESIQASSSVQPPRQVNGQSAP
jgi:hypothetical protein